MPYKMKGNPMQRNFGIGGPMKKNDDTPPYKHPSNEQKAEMSIKASKKAGKNLTYNPQLSEKDGAPRFS